MAKGWIRSQGDAAGSLVKMVDCTKLSFGWSGLVGHRSVGGEILGIAGPVDRRLSPMA